MKFLIWLSFSSLLASSTLLAKQTYSSDMSQLNRALHGTKYKSELDSWKKNYLQLRVLLEKDSSFSKKVRVTSMALEASGMSSEGLIYSGDYRSLHSPIEGQQTTGLITASQGRFSYVKWNLMPRERHHQLERGARLSRSVPFFTNEQQPIHLSFKSSPIGEETKVTMTPATKPIQLVLKEYTSRSWQQLQVNYKKVSYVHALSCDLQKGHTLLKNKFLVLDLRDSRCLHAESLRNLVANFDRVFVLVNAHTSLDSERVAISLQRDKKVLVFGEPSAGFYGELETISITSSHGLFLTPKGVLRQPRLEPDYPIRDSFIFAGGQDLLLSESLETIVTLIN